MIRPPSLVSLTVFWISVLPGALEPDAEVAAAFAGHLVALEPVGGGVPDEQVRAAVPPLSVLSATSVPLLPERSAMPSPLPVSRFARTMLPAAPSPPAPQTWMPVTSLSVSARFWTVPERVSNCSCTPWSQPLIVPLVTVTPGQPSLRTPVPSPTPSIVWPPRSTMMRGAPITSPSPVRQSVRSLITFVLRVSSSPQPTVASTGGSGGAGGRSESGAKRSASRGGCSPFSRPWKSAPPPVSESSAAALITKPWTAPVVSMAWTWELTFHVR